MSDIPRSNERVRGWACAATSDTLNLGSVQTPNAITLTETTTGTATSNQISIRVTFTTLRP